MGNASEYETLSEWKKYIESTIGEKSGLFGLSGIEIDEHRLKLNDGKTSAVCLEYRSKFNRGNLVQDCFFFQNEKLIAFRLINDQQECFERCPTHEAAEKHMLSLGFNLDKTTELKTGYLAKYKNGGIIFNSTIWGVHAYISDQYGNKYNGLSQVVAQQRGCFSVYHSSIHDLLIHHSSGNNPNLICTSD